MPFVRFLMALTDRQLVPWLALTCLPWTVEAMGFDLTLCHASVSPPATTVS